MKTKSIRTPKSSKSPIIRAKGGALITVLVLGAAILLLVGSYLSSLVNQQRLIHRTMLQDQARNAAEAVAAIATGEIEYRAVSLSTFFDNPANLLSGFSLSTQDRERLASTGSNVINSSLEFKMGQVSNTPASRLLLPVTDPVNRNDPDANRQVLVRTVNLFTKATARDTFFETSSYLAKHIRFTSGAWFDYAVFFNMDMEMHAGARLDVGPTHANGDIYLTGWNPNSPDTDANALTFTGRVTSTGNIYRFLKYHRGDWDAVNQSFTATEYPRGADGSQVSRVYATTYPSVGDPHQNMRMENNIYIPRHHRTINDSSRTDRSFAEANVWEGGVMDGSMGIPVFNPPGMLPYVPETYNDAGDPEGNLRNHAYLLVEPQLPNGGGHKGLDLENLKFSARAGLTIRVFPTTNNEAPKWELVWYEPTDSTKPISFGNLPRRGTDGTPIEMDSINPFDDVDDQDFDSDGNPPTDPVLSRALRIALLKAIISVPYRDNGPGNYGDGANSRTVQRFERGEATAALVHQVGTGGTIRTLNANNTDNDLDDFNAQIVSEGNQNNPHFFPVYDRREGAPNLATFGRNAATEGLRGAFHTLIIDMVQLHNVLNDNDLWLRPNSTGHIYDPDTQFNGVLYVEMPLAAQDNTRFVTDGDRIRPALAPSATNPGYAVLIRNAGGTRNENNPGNATEPNGFGGGTGFLPRGNWNAAAGRGFTFATNGPVYLWGHYNANGIDGAGGTTITKTLTMSQADAQWETSHMDPANPGSRLIGVEVPALIAADAVTQLSASPDNNTRDFELMTQQIMSGNRWNPWENTNGTAAMKFTELSAAILTGIIPTRPGFENIWSGGVHNFVRFLQNWQGTGWSPRFWGYRGSLVALFESEVAKKPYREGDNAIFFYWFNGPDLVMGHHPEFRIGNYPPGTPVVHTMRVLNIREISAEDYATGPDQPPPYNN
jgi:hypothetical protein